MQGYLLRIRTPRCSYDMCYILEIKPWHTFLYDVYPTSRDRRNGSDTFWTKRRRSTRNVARGISTPNTGTTTSACVFKSEPVEEYPLHGSRQRKRSTDSSTSYSFENRRQFRTYRCLFTRKVQPCYPASSWPIRSMQCRFEPKPPFFLYGRDRLIQWQKCFSGSSSPSHVLCCNGIVRSFANGCVVRCVF
jgi:hypothetical protein